jgi:hypothetical protein
MIPEIDLVGDGEHVLVEHSFLECLVRPRRPLKIQGNDLALHPAVLITAAGLQGEQPLVDRIM